MEILLFIRNSKLRMAALLLF